MKETNPGKNKWIWVVGIILVVIGVVVISLRTRFLVPVLNGTYKPTIPRPGMPHFPEEGFVNNPGLTLLHLMPALLYSVLGLLQFVKRIRAKYPYLHRWNGRIVLVSGFVVGISGIIMGFKMAISGLPETAATTLFGVLFLICLSKAYVHIRKRQYALHREWMIRAYAIGMAVTATRPIVGVFFATSPLTGLGPRDFFGTALWLGFTISAIAAEIWINRTRQPA